MAFNLLIQSCIFIAVLFQLTFAQTHIKIADVTDVVGFPENSESEEKTPWEWEALDYSVRGKSWTWVDSYGRWITWIYQSTDDSGLHGGGIKFIHKNEDGKEDYILITWSLDSEKKLLWRKYGVVHQGVIDNLPSWEMTENDHTWGFLQEKGKVGFVYDDDKNYSYFKK